MGQLTNRLLGRFGYKLVRTEPVVDLTALRLSAIEEQLSALDSIEDRLGGLAVIDERLGRLTKIDEKLGRLSGIEDRLKGLAAQAAAHQATLNTSSPHARLAALEANSRSLIEQQAGLRVAIDTLLLRSGVYLGDSTVLTWLSEGYPILVDSRDRGAGMNYLKDGGDEEWLKQYILENLKPDSCFIDVGANHGYFSIVAGRSPTPNLTTHAYEPNPVMFNLLTYSAYFNVLGGPGHGDNARVKLHNLALSNRPGEIELVWHSGWPGGGRLRTGDLEIPSEFHHVKVPVERFDDTFADPKPISVIKIDAEGNELSILDGMRASIAKSPRCSIVLEWLPELLFSNNASDVRANSTDDAFRFFQSLTDNISIIPRDTLQRTPVRSSADLSTPSGDIILEFLH